MAYVVGEVIEKGGSTKTTTTIHLPAALARHQQIRSLIFDMDPQMNTTETIGPETIPDSRPTMYELLKEPHQDIRPAIVRSTIEGVDLVCGARALGVAEELLMKSKSGAFRDPNTVLKRLVSQVPDEYDVVFIDCPPSVGLLNANAIVAADHLLVPIEASSYGVKGFEKLALSIVQMMQDGIIAQPPQISVLFSRIQANRKRNVEKRAELQQIAEAAGGHAVYIFENVVRYRDGMETLPEKRLTAFDVPKLRDVAEDYTRVAEEFVERLRASREAAAQVA